MHPNLRYFSLKIVRSSPIPLSQRKINWIFPSIEALSIYGMVHYEHVDPIRSFLSRHINGLTALDMGYRASTGEQPPGYVPANMWDLCPTLSQFGIHSSYLSQGIELLGKERDPSVHPPLELLIHAGFNNLYINLPELAIILNSLIKKWNITKIISLGPWNKVSSLNRLLQDIPSDYALFRL
jgi:hypothetical protein